MKKQNYISKNKKSVRRKNKIEEIDKIEDISKIAILNKIISMEMTTEGNMDIIKKVVKE